MNFLEICIRVNKLSGLHGSMTDVESTRDLQSQIANSVNEAWTFLQNYRKDWSFMINEHEFSCEQGEEIYVPYDALPTVPDIGIEDLGTYIKSGIFLDYRPLKYIEVYDYPFLDNTVEGKPTWFTIDPKNNNLYLDLPDDTYDFVIYYRKEVQDLFTGSDPNSNTPELPENYHSILIYAGLAAFAVFIGNPELYGKYQVMYDQMLGSLMREYLPSKKIRSRSII